MTSEYTVENHWRQAAFAWDKHRDVIREMFLPITEALISETFITRGSRVLDVGTGPGEPALSMAALVGKEGTVHAVDPAPEMIAAALRASARAGADNVHFAVGSADHLDFANDAFDAIVSRFAAMFFPVPLESIREILRVLKSGRRVAFAVWSFADKNPFHHVLSRVVDRYVDPQPPAAGAPDAFRYAAPGSLRTILDQAGAADTSERLLQFEITASVSVEEFWDLRSEMSDKLRTRLATASPEVREKIRTEVIDELRQYSREGKMRFPAEVLIVSGRKP